MRSSKTRSVDSGSRHDAARRMLLRGGVLFSSLVLLPRKLAAFLLGAVKPGGPVATSEGIAMAEGKGEGAATEVEFPHEDRIPAQQTIYGWIEQVFAGGVRRPAYFADQRAEKLCLEHFRRLGLEQVRLEPVELDRWEPRSQSLRVRSGDTALDIPCFPLPHSAAASGLDGELVAFDGAAPAKVEGKVSLCDVTLMRIPPAAPVLGLPASVTSSPDLAVQPRAGGRVYDPNDTFVGTLQTLPFGPQLQDVMEPSIEAGAVAFVGILDGYPGDSCEYYVPYDGKARPIPGVWIRASDGVRLRSLLAAGPVEVRLEVDSVRERVTCHNVVGELPGKDDEMVVIGTHHDGPWSSAVEDASGIGLVLAQATYWSAVPEAERPHRLVFLVNAGHMTGGAGVFAFLKQHAAELERIVLEVHLEHAAREFVERDGRVEASGWPETRWWFTSRIPRLEEAVWGAIEAEGLERSLLLPPDVFAPIPTTDGGPFHLHQVPLVNFLTAPFYLFDAIDRLDKIHVESLRPVTRAAIRIIRSTDGVSAAAMRKGRVG